MKLPESIWVFGFDWDVMEVRSFDPILDGGRGICILDAQQIFIADNLTPQLERETVLHEILHVCEDAVGLDLEEQVVTRLSRALFATLKDNPDLRAYLFEGGS